MLKCYFDKSGQEDRGSMTLSGIAASAAEWTQIDADWMEILGTHKPPAPFIHMRQAVGLRPPFDKASGWDADKIYGLINSLVSYLSCIPPKTYCQFVCTVDMDAYRRLRGESYQMDSPAELLTTSCTEQIMSWYMLECKDLDLEAHYYFDKNEPFEEIVKGRWRSEVEVSEKVGEYSTKWGHIKRIDSAEMRVTPGIQVADMLAWAINREKNGAKTYYELAIALTRLPPCQWFTWDEVNLRKRYHPLIYKPYAAYGD